MFIHKDKCSKVGLPEPFNYEKQINYILRLIVLGYKVNTRIARYIGIHNLHSIISALKKKGYSFTVIHGQVKCPFLNEIPQRLVDIVFMTPDQLANFKKEKAAKKK